MNHDHQIKSLYLHFPFCRHLCNYCDFYKIKVNEKPTSDELTIFYQYLEVSFAKLKGLMRENNLEFSALETLYIGGGTPSLWEAAGIKYLSAFLSNAGFVIEAQTEVTLEVNPGSWKDDSLDAFAALGGNRYSIGLQALDARFLKWLDRVHSIEDSYKTLEYFGYKELNYSVDFMLGLPFSKFAKRNILKELEDVLKFNPQHVSLYILTTGVSYPYLKELPDEDWIHNEYLDVSNYLISRGFEHYEVSNFAKPGKRSRHNLKYWYGENMASLGPSATGFFKSAKIRYKWIPSKADYTLEKLSQDELKLESLYLALRLSDAIDASSFFQDEDLLRFMKLLESWEQRGLIKKSGEYHFNVLPRGFVVMDSLMGEVFSHIKSF